MPKKQNKRIIVGIDEVGRGPIAGPVLACALVVFDKLKIQKLIRNSKFEIKKLKDSKKMSRERRERAYETLKNQYQVMWGIGRVSEKVIDKINILEATKSAMVKAVKDLEKQLSHNQSDSSNSARRKLLLIDGNFGINLKTFQKSIIKGDEKIFEIKLASIIAKVERDRIMLKYHKKYPNYGFDRHKGYPTKLHIEMLKKYGHCEIHRKSFKPVKGVVKFNFYDKP